MQYGFILDHRKCIGCHACTVACKAENEVPLGSFRTWVKYTEIGVFPQVKRHFAVLRCNQCTKAPCVTICPVNALSKRADGIVDLDKDACIGCKACMQACPYDAIYLNEDTGGAEKCHFCAHRVEQGLKPACEIVCPEEAIVSGDVHDPESRVSRLLKETGQRVVRRPEQNTGPNVFYLGIDEVSLEPGLAREGEAWLWSERRLPAPDLPPDFPVHPTARTVLDVDHDVHWGGKVAAYLVTKGIAAGAALLAPVLPLLGIRGLAGDWLPELLALWFTLVTVVLLVSDLKRPMLFFRLLTRPNLRSWLVKGGLVLSAFAAVTSGVLLARALGYDDAAEALRWVNVPLGLLTAIYTAFLFQQCEGRDLWQAPGALSVQLTAQALMLGAGLIWPAALVQGSGHALFPLAIALGAFVHHAVAAQKQRGPHATANARQAAAILPRIPLAPGRGGSAFRTGLAMTSAAGLATLALGFTPLAVGIAFAVCPVLLAGLMFYEQAFVRAAQLPPLS
ncbi:MAG: polysulfide reductase NrfD [Planctomycetes bacterium]|nr:polysulfide reductase NrfD [Planctomycetota bacterium]